MPFVLRWSLPLIILAEPLGTAPWFSANGVADRLALEWGIGAGEPGSLTGAVQVGFIASTLLIALWPFARDGQ